MTMTHQIAGLGNPNAKLNVFLANNIPLTPYNTYDCVVPVVENEIHTIGVQTSNHWRKIFNVYAKLLGALYPNDIAHWQTFRDTKMLTADSNQSLIYSPITIDSLSADNLNIVMGKTYAINQGLTENCLWVSPDFAINKNKQLVVCPYFDYRQLSNIKIEQLVQLIHAITESQLPSINAI
ncbi:DUF6942 family protein [Thalassotalea fusca]